MPVDLHLHTTASDGALSPAKLVAEAKKAGLDIIAITDHDSTGGVEEGLEAGKKLGVEVIPGVEVNTDYRNTEVHILGYFLDFRDPRFQAALHELRNSRIERAKKMIARLEYLGFSIDFERVQEIAGDGSIGRPHIAAALVERGLVLDIRDAFSKLLAKGRPAYVPRYKFTPEEAVRIILRASGIPVLAHPGLTGCDEVIGVLAQAGLSGLEVWHSDHTEQQSSHYLHMARRMGLVPTLGSDWHGPAVKNHIELGALKGGNWIVDELKSRHTAILHRMDRFS